MSPHVERGSEVAARSTGSRDAARSESSHTCVVPMMIFTMRTQALGIPILYAPCVMALVGALDTKIVGLSPWPSSAVRPFPALLPTPHGRPPRSMPPVCADCRHVVAPRCRCEDVNPSRCAGELVGADVMWLALTAAV